MADAASEPRTELTTAVAFPLLERYHGFAIAGKGKAALARAGLRVQHTKTTSALAPGLSADDARRAPQLPGATDSLLTASRTVAGVGADADLARAALLALEPALVKDVGANYFIGLRVEASPGFAAAAQRVREDAERRYGHERLDGARLPRCRWTLCLLVLHVYTPAALEEVCHALHSHLGPALQACGLAPSSAAAGESGCAASLGMDTRASFPDAGGSERMPVTRIGFEGLRALGPSKLVAMVCAEHATRLRKLSGLLHGFLARWAEPKPPSILPHVTLFKHTWVPGDKKGKAKSTATARDMAMQRQDWSGLDFSAEVCVGPQAPWSLLQIEGGGGASMGEIPHSVVWQFEGR